MLRLLKPVFPLQFATRAFSPSLSTEDAEVSGLLRFRDLDTHKELADVWQLK